jgi:hypothetical protein
MADFCNQCAVKHFGLPTSEATKQPSPSEATVRSEGGDLSGLTPEDKAAQGLYAYAICEGCGYCQVDPLGNCVSPDCFEKHGRESP